MYLALAPAISRTPIIMAISTDAVPRSGWMMTSAVGKPDQEQPFDESGVVQRVGAVFGQEGGDRQQAP